MKLRYIAIVGVLVVVLGMGVVGLLRKDKAGKEIAASPTVRSVPTEEQRPKPPEGYVWQECKGSKSAFLKPKRWFFREENDGSTQACFISKEEIIGDNGEFQTGLSVHGVKDVLKKTGMSPSAFVNNFFAIKSDQSLVKRRGRLVDIGGGVIRGYGQLIESQEPGEKPIVQYNIVLGNDKTGSVYIMFFESPAAIWDQSWKVGEKIMENFAVDDEF